MRNTIITIAFFLIACKVEKPTGDCNTNYLIHIWNQNSSMAYANYYKVNNDSISIEFIGGVVGDTNKILLSKALTKADRQVICNCLGSFDIDTLKSTYIDRSVEDGDQKMIELKFGVKNKNIEVSNFYQKDLDSLFDVINSIIQNER